jgi:radical SAM-linked protein
VSLVSLSTTDHPGLETIVEQIGKKLPNKAVSISLSSLRADNFSLKMAEATAGGRKTGLTFAVEAGTQRLRDVINKNLTEEQLFETVKESLEHGFKSIKLYFMIGLPTETEEDILATADLLTRIGRLAKQYKGRSVNVTISPFSPKPGTPFQWEPQDSAAEMKRKIALIASNIRSRAINLREGDPGLSVLECRIARGGRDLAPVIHDAWKRGSRLDGWSEMFNGDLWNEAFHAVGIELAGGGGAVEPGAPLPWGHLHFGVDERYLLAERERSLSGTSTPDCSETCGNCGPYAALCNALKKSVAETQAPADTVSDGARKAQSDMYGRRKKQVVRNDTVPLHGTRLRIRYTKEGTIRFVGHLDMVRIFDRIMRRAGIPIAYSQGFHPHPKLSFGHPLPLGLTSKAEYVDITLSEPFPEFEKTLWKNLPDGLGLVRIAVIPDRASSLTQIVTVSDYFVGCKVDNETEARLRDILGRESIPVIRSTKRGDKEVDLRRGIEELIIADDRSGFTMRLSVETGTAVKPSEVLGLVFPGNHHADVERTEQYAIHNHTRVSPFDIMW